MERHIKECNFIFIPLSRNSTIFTYDLPTLSFFYFLKSVHEFLAILHYYVIVCFEDVAHVTG